MKSYCIVNDTTPDLHVGSDAVMRTIREAARLHGYTEVASHPVSTEITGRDYERLLARADLVLINGEGTMHGDSRGCKNLAHFAAVAKEWGKRVVLLNSCYDANSQVTANLLARCDLLCFRESQAQRTFARQCPQVSTRVVGDLSLQSFPRIERPASATDIVITDSVLEDATAALVEIGQHFNARYACVKEFRFGSRKNLPLRAAARAFARSVVRLQPRPGLLLDLVRHQSRATFHDTVRRAGVVITGRFHAVMYCLHNRVPFLYRASNTGKIDYVLADAGLDIARRKVTGLPDVLRLGLRAQDVVQAAAYSPEESERLDDYLRQQQDAVAALWRDVFA